MENQRIISSKCRNSSFAYERPDHTDDLAQGTAASVFPSR